MRSTSSRRFFLSQSFVSRRFIPAAFVSCAALLAAQPAAAVITESVDIPGSIHPISGDGTVVGVRQTSSGWQLFSWVPGKSVTHLGPFLGGGQVSAASHDARYLTGSASFVTGVNNQRAYRWSAATGFTELGTLGGDTSYGTDISSDGSVVVGQATLADGAPNAFRWEAGTMQNLGTLPGYSISEATGVSGDGLVVVGNSFNKAFRWNAQQGMVEIVSAANVTTEAYATNRDGSVVVGADLQRNNFFSAYRWTEAGGVQLLGTLGGLESVARDVNADGSVIVGSATQANGDTHAFRWTEASQMISLGVLSSQTGSSATGVSDDGHTIIGTSGNRSFIWTTFIPGNPDGILQDLTYLQSSVIQSADTVNHLISTQKRRLRDSAQQQCLPGALQAICLSVGASGYRSEADTDGNQRNLELAVGLRLNEHYWVGANLSAGRADIREQSAEQRKAFALGLWAAYQQNADQLGWGASVSASGGQSNNSLERGTGLLDVQRARVEMDMSGAALRLAANYGMQMGKSLVTPELALSHVRTRQDGFTERNVAFPLTIGATESQETLATLGVRMATPVTSKGTVHVSLAVDALLHEDTLPLEGRSAVPGFSHFQLDSSLNKRRVLPSASAGYSHALTANSSIRGTVQVSSSVYKRAQPVSGAGVQYRYAF